MKAPNLIGISASLRCARYKSGTGLLVEELAHLADEAALMAYLSDQAKICLQQFVSSGREEGLPFDEIYRRLRRLGGTRGLSNSEVCLAAAMWGAMRNGAEVEQVALAEYFPADRKSRDLEELKRKLLNADGLILATPVYFGDRSSLSQRFIEMIRSDEDLKRELAGKLYGGVSVGAKRNGGQETTLIYQLLDMLNLGFLGVGNDSETTSQYGGTGHAGDVGTMADDHYGLGTAVGTGRRIARVMWLQKAATDWRLQDGLRLDPWVLQDRNGTVSSLLAEPLASIEGIRVNLLELTRLFIRPCIACDICPTHVGPDEEYRCIIKKKEDAFEDLHSALIRVDAIMPAVFSPKYREGLVSVYQEFMERSRYLRRGDYVFSDRLVVPVVFEEVGTEENLHIRLMTSFLRHHTVMSKPIRGLLHKGKLLNPDEVEIGLRDAINYARTLTVGRLAAASDDEMVGTHYKPVGYVLSTEKDKEAEAIRARRELVRARHEDLRRKRSFRLEPVDYSFVSS